MLYIWPFMMFFSFPLIYPYVLAAFLLPQRLRSVQKLLPRIHVILGALAIALVIIHYNTIIHPFMLADNRHYTFYLFRRTILRHPLIKYLAAPLYLLCGWFTLLTLSGLSSNSSFF